MEPSVWRATMRLLPLDGVSDGLGKGGGVGPEGAGQMAALDFGKTLRAVPDEGAPAAQRAGLRGELARVRTLEQLLPRVGKPLGDVTDVLSSDLGLVDPLAEIHEAGPRRERALYLGECGGVKEDLLEPSLGEPPARRSPRLGSR